ncbi:MAG TPA: peptidoglycan DD-metalloendopeptidase family protein [Anaerolineales bacterium]|nr:peptidoglycan DD-metalloendopeptidase family protein [Anaerolineales bacterium]
MEKKKTPGNFTDFLRNNQFNLISWGVTALIVAALAGFGLWWTQIGSAASPSQPEQADAPSNSSQPSPALPTSTANTNTSNLSIGRDLELKTNLSGQTSTSVVQYQVVMGDSLFAIAKQYNIKPETILYSNKASLNDNPENLKPGMTLTIPPVDGILYTWKQGDTLQKVADEFKAKADDILNWPGNDLDLTNPQITPGTMIMIPGGYRPLIDWTQFIPTISRGGTGAGTGTSNIGTTQCGAGPAGPVSVWPVAGESHVLSPGGNNYMPTHLGVDLLAHTGDTIVAAGNGVVVIAAYMGTFDADNYGYGNFVEIDHGNGYDTLYAHLSAISVKVCQGVSAGEPIGAAGATGNATGPHLHFEVRYGGGNKDPWDFLPQ